MKREPKYSLRDYAELKGITEKLLRDRIRNRGIELNKDRAFATRKNGRVYESAHYPLSYLEKKLYSLTDGWEDKRL